MEDANLSTAIAEWNREDGNRPLESSGVSAGRFTVHARIRLPGNSSSQALLSYRDGEGRSLFRLYTRSIEVDSAQKRLLVNDGRARSYSIDGDTAGR